jgi:hypothetical protein
MQVSSRRWHRVFNARAVRSVQRGTIALAATSATATINRVQLEHAVLIVSVEDISNINALDRNAVRVELTDALTVTAYYNTSAGNSASVTWEVIEFVPGTVKRVQRGTAATAAASSTTATITAVNPAKSFVFNLGFTSSDSGVVNLGTNTSRWTVTNATTLTFNGSGAYTRTCGYQIVEMY